MRGPCVCKFDSSTSRNANYCILTVDTALVVQYFARLGNLHTTPDFQAMLKNAYPLQAAQTEWDLEGGKDGGGCKSPGMGPVHIYMMACSRARSDLAFSRLLLWSLSHFGRSLVARRS